LDVRVSCSCPSWVFYGAQYKAVLKDYLYGAVRPVYAPPKIRDKEGMQRHLDGDIKLSEIFMKIEYYDTMLKYLEEIIKMISMLKEKEFLLKAIKHQSIHMI
jgi:hypothetical protein